MAEFEQQAPTALAFQYMLAEEAKTNHVKDVLKHYFENIIHLKLRNLNCQLQAQKCKQLVSLIVADPDVSVKDIITSTVNGPRPETTDEIALSAIQELAQRHAQLSRNKDILHLLISLPTNQRVRIGGSDQVIDEATMRRIQFKHYADHHPTMNDADMHSSQSNAAFVEVDSAGCLYSVMRSYVKTVSELPAENLFIVVNGHGTEDGKLKLRDGTMVHVNDILSALQNFRQEAPRSERPPQRLHIIFAQCHSHALDWRAAVEYDLITDVISLTDNEPGRHLTHNVRTLDGRIIHEELMAYRSQTTEFLSLSQERRLQETEERARVFEERCIRAEEELQRILNESKGTPGEPKRADEEDWVWIDRWQLPAEPLTRNPVSSQGQQSVVWGWVWI